jgi:hypothetical protein
MIQDISILITGNPNSAGGARTLGKYGEGLSSIDPTWPIQAGSDYIVSFKTYIDYTIYRLQYRELLITAMGTSRAGCFNIQLRIPANCMIIDNSDKQVSPYKLLLRIAEEYQKSHMMQYEGLRGWTYVDDKNMSQEDFNSLLSDYDTRIRLLPNRPMSGNHIGVIVIDNNMAEELLNDHCYSEFCDFSEIVIASVGKPTPQLENLEIPRSPLYEIFVNGSKRDALIGEDDDSFNLQIMPPHPEYQEPTTLYVDIEDARQRGLLNTETERIDYTVEFEDKCKTITVEITAEGENFNDDDWETIFNEVRLKGTNAYKSELLNPTQINTDEKIVLFTLVGDQILNSWKPTISSEKLPERISIKRVNTGFDNKIELILDKKEESKPLIDIPKPVQESNEVEFPIWICSDLNDSILCSHINLSIKLSVNSSLPSLIYKKDLALKLRNDKKREFFKYSNLKRKYLYESSIQVPAYFIDKIHSNSSIQCKINDSLLDLENDPSIETRGIYYKGIDTPAIVLFVHEKDLKKRFFESMRNNRAIKFIVLIFVFLLGFCLGNRYQSWHHKGGGDVQPDSIRISKKDTISPTPNPVDTITPAIYEKGNDRPVPDEKKDYNKVQEEANKYKDKIKEANISFTDIASINQWIIDNHEDNGPIIGYNYIKNYIKYYSDCDSLLKKIDTSVNEDFVKKLNKTIENIPKELQELRKKMQYFTRNKKNEPLSDKEIQNKLYDWAKKKRQINSFNDIK